MSVHTHVSNQSSLDLFMHSHDLKTGAKLSLFHCIKAPLQTAIEVLVTRGAHWEATQANHDCIGRLIFFLTR